METFTTLPPNATIAQAILSAVADMRRNGSFTDGTTLCWNPRELELLAMFAMDSKRRWWREALEAAGRKLRSLQSDYAPVQAGYKACQRALEALEDLQDQGPPA